MADMVAHIEFFLALHQRKDSVVLHGDKNSNTKISIGASSSHQTAFSQFVYLIKNDPLKTHLEHLVWQEQRRLAIPLSSPSCFT